MSVWVPIEHAPKDQPVDLWGAPHAPEISKSLMMVHAIYMQRWTDCRWSPRVLRASGLMMNLPEGWYSLTVRDDKGGDIEANWRRIWPTHFMLIPAGPACR